VELSRPNAKDVGQTESFIAKPGRSLSTGRGHALDVVGLNQVNKASEGFNEIVPIDDKIAENLELSVVTRTRECVRWKVQIKIDVISGLVGEQFNPVDVVKCTHIIFVIVVVVTSGFTVNVGTPTYVIKGTMKRHSESPS
jgi:hypothetical protein